MPQPYKLFTIYAREDAQYLEELRGQLRPLEHAGRIKVWSDREINPGVDWEKEIVQNLDTADIILILVSAAYYNSAYIHEKEIKHAISRHERGEAKVLPVIVRPCSFLDDPVISRLQVLPTDGKPVTDRRHWQDRDDAWLDVVAGVKRTIEIIRDAENRTEQEIREAAERERLAVERKKEEEKRARQAELEAHERAERGRREAEHRTREEQAHYEQEAEATRQREAQLKREREEQERLERLHLKQEEAYRRADSVAWLQASNTHDIEAYQTYLAHFPQGEMVREARHRIKELRPESAIPIPMRRFAAIGGGALALLLAVWLLPKMFGGEKDQKGVWRNLPPQFLPENVGAQINKKSGIEMVQVEGGTFQMGSPKSEEGRDDDECQHSVTVRSFSIGKYEVTQADWREIMGSNPSYFKNCDDCPVEQISWNDIQDFLKKLNATLTGGQKPYRLPTEEEWEYAARGGTAGSNTYFSYSGSNDLNSIAWHTGNSGSKTHPVGAKKHNQLGLYDMSGNVWEWCSDTYESYPCNSKKTADGSSRVFRGGCWGGDPKTCRAADRYYIAPAYRYDGVGFRLASSSY